MVKYKINYIFEGEKNINDIFIKVLNNELKKHIEMLCKKKKEDVLSSYMKFFSERDKNYCDDFK